MLGLSGPNSSENALTLAEILRRTVVIEWFEGVAMVRAIIDRINSAATPAVPELHQVELEPSGRVTVTGGSSTDEPVRRLGQLLQATFGRSDPPVQLRLMISQATAPTPAFASVREFDEVLGYYERPNREASLQALYDRAANAPPAQDSGVAPTLDRLAPLPTEERKKPAKPPKPPEVKRRQRRLAIAAVGLLLVVAGLTQYVRNLGAAESAQVAELTAKASDVMGSAVVSGLSKVTETVGLGRLVSESEANATPPAPVLTPTLKMPVTSRRGAREPLSGEAIVLVYDLDIKPSIVPSSAGEATSEPPAAAVETPPPASNGGPETETFTPANSEVVPPIGIRPQLPRELPKHVSREDLTRIELLIAADGTVETVKLVSSPRTVHDSMWLSAIKAWQFQPAMKDGRPVRYLKTVWIAPQ
jgi:TonB-like protein